MLNELNLGVKAGADPGFVVRWGVSKRGSEGLRNYRHLFERQF